MKSPDDLRWPALFSGGTVVHFEPAEDLGEAYFGGPLEQAFDGEPFGPAPLHRIFTFSPAGVPQPAGHNLQGFLSLFYGMRFSGCELRYSVATTSGVNAQYIRDSAARTRVTSISPAQSCDDWPYADYPRLLPYVPLREASRHSIESGRFAELYTWQGLEDFSADELVVVVPAVARLGVSMWGRSGDQEAAILVFRYRYLTHEVHASSQCG